MEKIYNPQSFDCTEHVNIKEFFQKFSSQLYTEQQKFPTITALLTNNSEPGAENDNTTDAKETLTKKVLDEKIFSFMSDLNIDTEQQQQLSKICNPNNLTIEEEIQQIDLKDIFGAVGITKNFKPYEYTSDSLKFETVKRYKNKPTTKRLPEDETMNKKHFELDNVAKTTNNNDLKPGVDFAVFVRFYHPFAYNYATNESKKYLSFDHEIILLGSNTLADLKDKIFCFANTAIITDVSEDLSTQNVLHAQDLYPSSFIFIDDTFYNDFRNPDCKDNSEVIRKWAAEKKIANFQTDLMDSTRIDSLKPRFGYPYVYQHQGKCEHIFIFAQARLLNMQDCLSSKEYPYYSGVCGTKATFCYICGHSQAVWIVLDCKRLPLNKTPLCNDCLKSYCYLGGAKIDNFKCFAFSNRKDLL